MKVLVFSKTAGFRHDCIETGQAMLQELGEEHGFEVALTEDSSQFTPRNLNQFSALVFLCTSGDILDDSQREALKSYIELGGGYVGIHAASDTEFGWPWYETLVGAWFLGHPAIQEAEIKNEGPTNPRMAMWPANFSRTDEWYDFRTNPRPNVHVLASLVKSSYQGSKMEGDDHPITWEHEVGKGRAFYTGFGHTKESFAEPAFRQMVVQALLWTSGI